MENLTIRELQEVDILLIAAAFAAIGWNKPAEQYQRYFEQQIEGKRVTLVAFLNMQFVGYLNVVWEPDYPPFREAGIPEIQDFNVLPEFQRRGIGSLLMDAAEQLVGTRSNVVGIGVGLLVDYGAAQRLYISRGYVPDGRGICYDNRPVSYGETVKVDDNLTLHFTRRLR